MRRAHGVVAVLALSLLLPSAACDGKGAGSGAAGDAQVAAAPDSLDPICADSTIDQLCPVVPHEVVVRVPNGYTGFVSATQAKFDVYSWQTFVALNWPAAGTSGVVPQFSDDTSPRVWETYLDAAEVYSAPGNRHPCSVPPGQKFLGSMAKNGDVVDPDGDYDEAVGGPLMDANLNFAVYEKKINGEEATYLRSHLLNTPRGQFAADTADTALVFPAGRTKGTEGAIEVKAAWRVLQSNDDSTRYFRRHGVIYVPPRNSANGDSLCLNVTVGLVGMHIVHKTDQFLGDWIWSTFEQEDNAPLCADSTSPASCGASQPRWSFYNAACTTCVRNDSLHLAGTGDSTFLWNPTPPYAARYAVQGKYGNQITRVQVPKGETDTVNATWHARVKGTVWEHYHLIGSQWMSGERSLVAVPDTLRNTVLESYIPTTSSCLGCHQYAQTLADTTNGNKSVFADFSFLLGMAQQRTGEDMLADVGRQKSMPRSANVPFRHPTLQIFGNPGNRAATQSATPRQTPGAGRPSAPNASVTPAAGARKKP